MLALLVSPDAAFLDKHEAPLRREGYEVERCREVLDLPARLAEASAQAPSLVVLHGATAAVLAHGIEAARKALPSVRIMVMDAALGLDDKSRLIDAGADDCQSRELPEAIFLARARNLLRSAVRSAGPEAAVPPSLRSAASLSLDTVQRTAFLDGRQVSLTRLQFDVLAGLTARSGEACAREALVADLLEKGHPVDDRRLTACVQSVNALLSPFATVEEAQGGFALRAGEMRARLKASAGRLFAAFSGALSNARVYGASHPAVLSSLSEALEQVRVLCDAGGKPEVVVSLSPGGVQVDGLAPDPPPGAADPGTAFLRRFGLASFGVSRGATADDLAQFCRASLAPPQMPPRDALDAMLAKAAPGSLTVDYSAARVKEEGRAVAERLAEVLSRNPAGGAALFHPDGELVFKARQKLYKARGRAEVEAFFSAFPQGLELNVTSCESAEGGFKAECVVISPRYGAAKDFYSFRLQDGLIIFFEAASRLRL